MSDVDTLTATIGVAPNATHPLSGTIRNSIPTTQRANTYDESVHEDSC